MVYKLRSIVVTFAILVVVATAHPYNEWNNARHRWNDLFASRVEEIGARIRSQPQADVKMSSCATVTEMKDGKPYRVRVCTADPEDSPNKVCLGTRVNTCCPTADFSLGNLVSSTQVNVAGEDVTVAYYLTQDPTVGVCFRLDDAHLRAETCSQSRLEGIPCLPPCSVITTTCFNNTLTGDSSSCDGSVCQCKTGYLPPDCCGCDTDNFYLPDCKPFCKDNCHLFQPGNVGGCLTCRAGFIGAPECCQCEPGKTEVDGVCKCDANLKPDGTCAEGALEPDCCRCDPTGNATHAFYKTSSGECKPFCKSNCAVRGSSGCATCKTGFMSVPECCQCEPGLEEVNGVCKPEKCNKQQTLYFYIDATDSNTFENFCPLIVVMQMLVAAFNPSENSGTKIRALLFPDIQRSRGPSPVFDESTTCHEAIQGRNRSLLSLLTEFGKCLDKNRNYNSTAFPSSCGEGTSAVKGLEEIYRLASSRSSSRSGSTESAVLMLTDGVIMDNSNDRTTVLQNLNSAGVRTFIAAGINDGTSVADRENLKSYTSDDNIIIREKPVELGIAIVRKLVERGILCKDHADNIIASFNNAQEDQPNGHQLSTLKLFCACHRSGHMNKDVCTSRRIKYPTCGDDVSIGVPPATTQEALLSELDSQLSLEEEILAAVENVLKRFEG